VEMISEAVPFPAVTLCNFRSLRFDVINRINDHFTSGGYVVTDDPFMTTYMLFASKLTNIIVSDRYETDHQVRLAVQVNGSLLDSLDEKPTRCRTTALHSVLYAR